VEEKVEIKEETVVGVSEQPMKKVGGLTTMSAESHSKVVESRWDKAIADAKQVNRSADLVPLQLQLEKVKKQLKSAIVAAQAYHDAMLNMDMARIRYVPYVISIPAHSSLDSVISHNVTRTHVNLLSLFHATKRSRKSSPTWLKAVPAMKF
jgi:hypothetical protein